MIYQSHGIINSDGILYVEVAKQFTIKQWEQGLALYNWPLYPLLMSEIHDLSGLGFQTSAHLITVVMFALSCAGIIMIAKEAGGDRTVMLLTLLLILTSPYLVRSLLPLVVRDHGFLSFHIWSLVFFLRFLREEKWRHALAWGLTGSIATMFRIEGIVYLLGLPLVALMLEKPTWQARIKNLIKLEFFPIIATLVMAVAMLSLPSGDAYHLGRLTDPIKIATNVYYQISHGLADKADIYSDHVLGSFLDDYAFAGLILTLAWVLITKSLGMAGWIHIGIVGASKALQKNQGPAYPKVFIFLLTLSLLNGAFILLSAFVLSARYLTPIAVLIILYAGFGLKSILKPSSDIVGIGQKQNYKWLKLAIVALLVLQSAANLWPQASEKQYEIMAAEWVKTHIPPRSHIYYDYGRLRYYVTGESYDREQVSWEALQQLISSGQIKEYEYAMIHVSNRHTEQKKFITDALGNSPIKSFKNDRDKELLIYAIKSPRKY